MDPDAIDRGNAGHARAQNALADHLRARGIEPKSPQPYDPDFDLAWEHEALSFVAEVKSLTRVNEEKQLRLGLGQVLRYQHALSSRCSRVVAVIVAEREPSDPAWASLCASLGVRLVWPGSFDGLTEAVSDRVPTKRTAAKGRARG